MSWKRRLFGSERRPGRRCTWRITLNMRRKSAEKHADRVCQHRKIPLLLQRRFIDIETAIDLDLQRMQPARPAGRNVR